ncbi:signal recognition particle-docking protein FtsY [Sinomonas sp. R1AF57]|nr:signal recognition particle-docking protein FtsY [Sinomonas sp. R1AF57]
MNENALSGRCEKLGPVTDLSALLPVIIIVGIVVLVIAGIVVGLVSGRRKKIDYTGTRDANDQVIAPERPASAESEPAPAGVGTLPPPAEPQEAPTEDVLDEAVIERVPTEAPAPVAGRLIRLRERLAKSNSIFGKGLLALLSSDRIDEGVWEEVEETLLLADIGTDASMDLVDTLRERVRVMGTRSPEEVRAMLREELVKLVDPTMDRTLNVARTDGKPAVVLVVGVNGVGKTTTVGKLARVLVAEDKDVLLGAADTFRAAAAQQLATWGARVGVPTVKSDVDGADPASVAFEAVKSGIEQEVDVVMVDTAGRLQNKVGLMDELGKVKRVIEKQADVDEVLLVLDATTGQNGLAQAKVFAEVVDITGIVLTKLDGTAKGGIVVAIQKQLGVPVKLVGLGEGPDDLAPFDAESFVDAILA